MLLLFSVRCGKCSHLTQSKYSAMKTLFFSALGWCLFFTNISFASTTTQDYIKTYKAIASAEMQRTGVPASVQMALAIYLTNSGQSYLAKRANNHFALKCEGNLPASDTGWSGKKVYKKDEISDKDLSNACYRKFDAATQSFVQHTNWLKNDRRFKYLLEQSNADATFWIKELSKAGYPAIEVKTLLNLITTYELNELDAPKTILIKVEKTNTPKKEEVVMTSTVSNKEKKEIAQLKKDIATFAVKFKDTPYRYGGKTPQGFDCSGFTHYVMSKNGILLQGSSSEQAKQGKKIKWQEVETGDLIFFTHNKRTVGHVALVLERKDKDIIIIHATTSRGVVIENLLASDYWRNRIMSASRIIP